MKSGKPGKSNWAFKLALFALGAGLLLWPVGAEASTPRQHRIGDIGFHGGIAETRHLPRTTETIILQQGNNRNNNATITMEYREFVFMDFVPELFEGTMEVRNGSPSPGQTAGTFRVEHRVFPNVSSPDGGVRINRTMIFDVDYRIEGNNMIYTYNINRNSWRETIAFRGLDGEEFADTYTYVLDFNRSSFWVSVIEDRTPGVNYYRGIISARLFYTEFNPDGDATGRVVSVDKTGEFYGFSSAFSATETHRVDVTISDGQEAMTYQIRPSVTVNKIMQFRSNEPTIISFEGNFQELHQSFAGLRYDIFTRPTRLWHEPLFGAANLDTFNVFEQLPAPNMAHIRGHSAEDDIHRLFAMQILQGDTRFFLPDQAITRGQFMTALARAINLPVEEPPAQRGRQAPTHIFSDVSTERPEFRYIQAIHANRVAFGRADGSFNFDSPISRQEAVSTMVRALGLSNLSANLTVLSPFADSGDIANWAMQYTNTALGLGLIAPDANGNFHPNMALSNAQAATFLNTMINFLREGIVTHYADEIVNVIR